MTKGLILISVVVLASCGRTPTAPEYQNVKACRIQTDTVGFANGKPVTFTVKAC